MKRLRNIFDSLPNNTTTYTAMYEGQLKYVDPRFPDLPPFVDYNPTYYYMDKIGFEITHTHKLAQSKPTVTISIPCDLLAGEITDKELKCAAADYYLREFGNYISALNEELYSRSGNDKEKGHYYICNPDGEVLIRNSAYFSVCAQKDYKNGNNSYAFLLPPEELPEPKQCLCLKLQVQFPDKNIHKSKKMLCKDLPEAVNEFIMGININAYHRALELFKMQTKIRAWLKNSEYCAFIANGSILPRMKGSQLPLADAIPFCSTPDDEIEIFGIRGMGIRKGVTVITGGGYSGKSTLLDAISAGIYNHSIGDGRELCITDESAITISAEDGRCIKNVNISPFIKWLPTGDTDDFSTDHASGSTSQAANIMEAVDIGAKLLLIDEDRSATNFMIRDHLMKQLITKEPITPFTDRVNEMYGKRGISTILVIGGSGEYLSVADNIYMMDEYIISNVTDIAKDLVYLSAKEYTPEETANWAQCRNLTSKNFSPYPEGSGTERLEVSDLGFIIIGDEKIDVRGINDIVTPRQLDAIGFILRYIEISNNDLVIDVKKRVDDLYARINTDGLDFIYSSFFTSCERFFDLPRKSELYQVINRMRKTKYSRLKT